MRDFRHAKDMARTLRAALAASGIKITVSQSLELIAEAFGAADWNTLSAAIQADARNNATSPQPPNEGSGIAFSAPLASIPFAFSTSLDQTLPRAIAYANHRKHQY